MHERYRRQTDGRQHIANVNASSRSLKSKKLCLCISGLYALCGLRGIMHPWFISWFRCYMYIACLFTWLPPSLTSFFLYLFFRTYLLPYLPFPLRIGLLCFQSGGRKRRPKEDKRGDYQKWSVLFCVQQLCTVISRQYKQFLQVTCCLGLGFTLFVCVLPFMVALCNRADHYIFALLFLSPSIYLSFFYSSPNLSGRRLDVYHTLTHGVALVRI